MPKKLEVRLGKTSPHKGRHAGLPMQIPYFPQKNAKFAFFHLSLDKTFLFFYICSQMPLLANMPPPNKPLHVAYAEPLSEALFASEIKEDFCIFPYMAEKTTITNLEQAQAAAWKAIKETQEDIRKLSNENREFRKSLEESNKRTGKFDRKFGELWELMVVPNIKEKFNELGFRFDSVARDLEFDKPNGKTLAEVDILLENGDYAIAVEVKDSFKKKYLDEHLDRMKRLKTLPRFANKKLYGAIAAGFVKGESKQLAFEHGFYVVNRPDSMNVQIEQFPKGCKPRAW